jgi:hypothetical protein
MSRSLEVVCRHSGVAAYYEEGDAEFAEAVQTVADCFGFGQRTALFLMEQGKELSTVHNLFRLLPN